MSQSIIADIKAIQVVYIVLMLGVVFFLIIAILLIQTGGPFIGGDSDFMNMMLIVLLAMSAVTIPAGFILFKKQVKEAENVTNIGEKIQIYRSAIIVRAALFEGVGFFSVICILLFGHFVFIIIAVAVLILFGVFFPTRNRIASDLNIGIEELES